LIGPNCSGLSATDPVAWSTSVAGLLGIAALANVVPAARAARVELTVALRVE
jgi:hypothetical protein